MIRRAMITVLGLESHLCLLPLGLAAGKAFLYRHLDTWVQMSPTSGSIRFVQGSPVGWQVTGKHSLLDHKKSTRIPRSSAQLSHPQPCG